jgi:PBP1b-binding outer membrane lipoprotein LpoB
MKKLLVLIPVCLFAIGCSGGGESEPEPAKPVAKAPGEATSGVQKQGNAQASPYKAEDLTK